MAGRTLAPAWRVLLASHHRRGSYLFTLKSWSVPRVSLLGLVARAKARPSGTRSEEPFLPPSHLYSPALKIAPEPTFSCAVAIYGFHDLGTATARPVWHKQLVATVGAMAWSRSRNHLDRNVAWSAARCLQPICLGHVRRAEVYLAIAALLWARSRGLMAALRRLGLWTACDSLDAFTPTCDVDCFAAREVDLPTWPCQLGTETLRNPCGGGARLRAAHVMRTLLGESPRRCVERRAWRRWRRERCRMPRG